MCWQKLVPDMADQFRPELTPAVAARLDCARLAVREAGAFALRYFRDRDLVVEIKGAQDYVSHVDRETEALLIGTLRTEFADDAFLGEESGAHGLDADGRFIWVIDPIDGTTNYVHGLPLWCISVALVHGSEIVAGIIFNPVTDEFYEACAGAGATCNGQTLSVSGVRDPGQARVGMGFSYRRPPELHAEGVRRLLHAHCEYARFGSGALGMAYVADGRFDAYWEPHINAWDVLAGICLVREAGGWCNDFLAADGLRAGNPILACTPALKPFLMATLVALSDEFNESDGTGCCRD